MNTDISLLFRRSTRVGHHPGVLFIRLIRHRKSCVLTLNDCLIYPHEWDVRRNRINLSVSDTSRAVILAGMQARVDSAIRRLCELDSHLSLRGEHSAAELLSAYRLSRAGASLHVFSEHLSAELEQAGQQRTARAYRTVCRGFLAFVGRDDIPLRDLDARLLMFFERDLKNRGRQANTISYYMRNLRAIYNKAVRRSVIPAPPDALFSGVFTGVARTPKRALNASEVEALIREVPGEALLQSRARRYFAFCFYACGMCFVDLAHLRKEDISGDILRYHRCKTGRRIEVRLIPEMRAIIKSFSSDTAGLPYLFPILSADSSDFNCYESALRRQNRHLKRLASLAGVNTSVSTHWARHSWATLGKRAHIPIPVLSECLGHSCEQVTRIYLDSFEHGVLDRANRRIAGMVPYAGRLMV